MATPQPISSENDSDRYPIGSADLQFSPASHSAHIEAIRVFPEKFALGYAGLDAAQLDTPYREGGWTLRQLAHHMADSHMHAWLRLKFAVVEDWPTIKPYDEKQWAETAETRGSVDAPLALLVSLHARMAALLDSLKPEEWERGYVHPETGRTTIAQFVAMYSWHSHHHTAHVTQLRLRKGW